MPLEAYATTDAGPVRENNEDNFLVDEDSGFFIVADDALAWERTKNVEKALLGPAPNGLGHLQGLLPVLSACSEWTAAALEAEAYEHCVDTGEAAIGRAAFADVVAGGQAPWGPFKAWRH
jgi:hypothetical protein